MTTTRVDVLEGDMRDLLRKVSPATVDAVVTDPPYGLGFTRADWDSAVPGPDYWVEVHRAMRPGRYLVAFGSPRTFHRLAVALEASGFLVRDVVAWLYAQGFPKNAAALKPAYEPILIARARGRGGELNVEACRVGDEELPAQVRGVTRIGTFQGAQGNTTPARVGRWPANVVVDEAVAADLGDAARYFFVAKPSAGERHYAGPNSHPTVKPVALMQWLVRLVSRPGDLVLDPFCGSGSTGIAALAEGRHFLGLELDAEVARLARRRIAGPLFADQPEVTT